MPPSLFLTNASTFMTKMEKGTNTTVPQITHIFASYKSDRLIRNLVLKAKPINCLTEY